ncbi:EamA family transporter [Flavobacterium humi]|uniref:EamA/RhaT family transporter n=1 Tax=Flavobacterium humi TaxID=2562683 RepID=A0A4Z0LD44_9FLAO|nr:EamA family transporter [Flavobacterium humi]TGD59822.1 EamA/RhaT family transporter [Flavobacterium humi]
MVFVILSILCSVLVGVLLKTVKKNNLSFYQIITWNYVFALLLTYVAYKPNLSVNFSHSTGYIVLWLCLLLPVVFVFQAKAIRYNGIVKTDIAQRLSLFISLIASYYIFEEKFNTFKTIGLLCAFTAILLTLYKKDTTQSKNPNWYYLLLVLAGFGIIDVLFKKTASVNEMPFTQLLFFIFCGAMIIASLISLYYLVTKKEQFGFGNILWGLGVGVFNFANISFYIKAHQALPANPSTVFASMNMGVILLGSAVGILVFKEKMTKLNYLGIACSILAILCIAYSQLQ